MTCWYVNKSVTGPTVISISIQAPKLNLLTPNLHPTVAVIPYKYQPPIKPSLSTQTDSYNEDRDPVLLLPHPSHPSDLRCHSPGRQKWRRWWGSRRWVAADKERNRAACDGDRRVRGGGVQQGVQVSVEVLERGERRDPGGGWNQLSAHRGD